MPESKHDRFIRIAETRTNKIIDMIRLLGNCSNTATYEYSEDDVKKIFIMYLEKLVINGIERYDMYSFESTHRKIRLGV